MPTATSTDEPQEATTSTPQALETELVEPEAIDVTQQVQALETELVTLEPLETSEVAPTQVAETPEVFVAPDNVKFQSDDGNKFIVVARTTEGADIPILPEPPEGQRWFVVQATVGNRSETPITLAAESFTLVDQQQERYEPVEDEDTLRPALAGSVVGDPAATFVGVVRFAVPIDAKPYLLEWCSDSECLEPLQTLFP